MLFLDVLTTNNNLGSELFSKLFQKVDVKTILRFLDNSTSFIEDFKIISSFPKKIFLKALLSDYFTQNLIKYYEVVSIIKKGQLNKNIKLPCKAPLVGSRSNRFCKDLKSIEIKN